MTTTECNGICVTAEDIGFPEVGGLYAAHPDCPVHGHLATHEVDGTPRTGPARCGHDGCHRPAVQVIGWWRPNHRQFRGQTHDCCAVHSRGER